MPDFLSGFNSPKHRDLPLDTAKNYLKAGQEHNLAYIGPPDESDLTGAPQFGLLASLGLR